MSFGSCRVALHQLLLWLSAGCKRTLIAVTIACQLKSFHELEPSAWSHSSWRGRRSRIIAIMVFDLEKTGDLAHSYSAACIVAAFSFAISASARRYSTGITLRNNGR